MKHAIRMLVNGYKFVYGQGGMCEINLTKRCYKLEIQTAWIDHCELSVTGMDLSNLELNELGSKCYISDQNTVSSESQEEIVYLKLEVPEDYTFNGIFRGDLIHTKSTSSHQLRSMPTRWEIIEGPHRFEWGRLRTEMLELHNRKGLICSKSFEAINMDLKASKVKTSKITVSGGLELTADSAEIESLITHGVGAISRLKCKHLKLGSMSGMLQAECEHLSVERLYAQPGGIDLQISKQFDGVIMEGTGYIKVNNNVDIFPKSFKLGPTHPGKIVTEAPNIFRILKD